MAPECWVKSAGRERRLSQSTSNMDMTSPVQTACSAHMNTLAAALLEKILGYPPYFYLPHPAILESRVLMGQVCTHKTT